MCKRLLPLVLLAALGPAQQGEPGPRRQSIDDRDLVRDVLYWWEYQRDGYLPRPALPSKSRVGLVDPAIAALRDVLHVSEDRDLVGCCMIALARSCPVDAAIDVGALLRARLASPDQEIREAAALALGIGARPEAIDPLVELVRDSIEGRKLCRCDAVDLRTRTFALYGLGLSAARQSEAAPQRRVFAVANAALRDATGPPDLRVAAVHALSLLHLDPDDAALRALAGDAVRRLAEYADAERGAAEVVAQAHVPTAIARLLRRSGFLGRSDLAAIVREQQQQWLEIVESHRARTLDDDFVLQSAILALGVTTRASGADDPFALAVVRALDAAVDGATDKQVGLFARLAMGRIGGEPARTRLLARLDEDRGHHERQWNAMALGVLEHERRGRPGWQPDAVIGKALLACMEADQHRMSLPASALAVGLARCEGGGAALRGLVPGARPFEERAGALGDGLALAGDREAVAPLTELAAAFLGKPDLLRRTARSVAVLGGARELTAILTRALREPMQVAHRIPTVLGALGETRDPDAFPHLVEVLRDRDRTPLVRAFAAVSLGLLCERDEVPWNVLLSVDTNYRAAVSTLTDRIRGVLDLL